MNTSTFKTALAVLSTAAMTSLFAAPSIKDISVTTVGNLFTIAYELSDEDAIVTADIQTNGVSIGGANLDYMSGDVNAVVAAKPGRVIRWRADLAWPMHEVAASDVSVRLKAYPLSSPPQYMVVNLDDRLDTESAISYYESLDHLPQGGLSNLIYKTSRMVFRRIPSGGMTYRQGYDQGEQITWPEDAHEKPFYVTFEKDFYCAIYELTQAQAAYITSGVQPEASAGVRPKVSLSYDSFMSGTGILGLIRSRTKADAFNLPTSAQWEFACRAGVRTSCTSGKWITGTTTDANLGEVAWYSGNANSSSHEVGKKLANNFGLYDMQGNVSELCLDLVPPEGLPDNSGKTLADPQGYTGGDATKVVMRTRSFWYKSDYQLLWDVFTANRTGTGDDIGFRLVFNID